MRIEILTIEDCPNSPAAEREVRRALDDLGIRADPVVRVIRTPEEAAATAFAGSPTILVDGVDAIAGSAPITDLACRVYLTPAGPAGAPTAEMLIPAIRASRGT
ncbi:thioredoxin family protein [Microbacterium capsulatum]|uniref:Thioredoxin-like fold domain-containing protein n=1 Tax=Microbacterium capsulatum TaxID=3041921 RepID=A0ABU0XHC6_9MICO|nr:thioredoxin family protein [Microbacterium sp. ASV81]MDQ4214476.1 hypothetical protein [Microbacterium sp. ASV81]